MVPFEYHKPQTRASDSERQSIVAVLQKHYAEGRLDIEEFETRSSSALAARTHGELVPLISDLPVLDAQVRRHSGPPVRPHHGPTAMAVYFRLMAVVVGICVVIWAATGFGYPWPFWPAFGMSIPLLFMFAFRGGPPDR